MGTAKKGRAKQMPLVLEPDSHYEYVLENDKAKPKEKQPTFIFKYLNSRKARELAKLSDKFQKDDAPDDAAMDAVYEAIKIALVGWRNMAWPDGKELEFNPEILDEILTLSESIELLYAAGDQFPTFEDKKKLDSPSTSSTARSARTAKDRKTVRKSRRNLSR